MPIPTTTVAMELLDDAMKQQLIANCTEHMTAEGDAVDAYYPKLKARLEDPNWAESGPNVTIPNSLAEKVAAPLKAAAEKKLQDDTKAGVAVPNAGAVKTLARVEALLSQK
jgi:hypothetical protein